MIVLSYGYHIHFILLISAMAQQCRYVKLPDGSHVVSFLVSTVMSDYLIAGGSSRSFNVFDDVQLFFGTSGYD